MMNLKKSKISVVHFLFILVLQLAPKTSGATLEKTECGIDSNDEVVVGSDIPLKIYPWVGVLYYINHDITGEVRAVTTVVLIQEEFVIAAAADIGPMPKYNFRTNTRVLLGEPWHGKERRVRNYVIHPEYGETENTVALVQLREQVRPSDIKPVCPPPALLRDPEFFVIKFNEDYNILKKQVLEVAHVPGRMCKDFYVTANLYAKRMRPPHVACAVAVNNASVCVWHAGAALAARDVWGRWQLLGLGVRGPGCGAPSRYLDMMSYYPWVEASLSKFRQLTISKINKQKFVLRASSVEESESGVKHVMRYGACDDEERVNLVYRDQIILWSDNTQYQFMNYNMSIYEDVEYTCLTLELINASATSEMRVTHQCPRTTGAPCYSYKGSTFTISVYIVFSDTCLFDMQAWGTKKNMTLLDIQEWKWEEGTYYEDFRMARVEYRGQADMTGFGFEPLDEKMWVPEFDYWTTTTEFIMPSFSKYRGQADMTGFGFEPLDEKMWVPEFDYWTTTTEFNGTTPTTPKPRPEPTEGEIKKGGSLTKIDMPVEKSAEDTGDLFMIGDGANMPQKF